MQGGNVPRGTDVRIMELNNQNGVLSGIEMMGDNIRKDILFCGEGVVFYPLCKIVRACNTRIDDYTRICDYSFIDAGKSLTIGKHCMITWHAVIEGGGTTKLGDRCFLGPSSKLLTSTYEFDGLYAAEFITPECRDFRRGDITLEDDVYIGANCIVMPGVHIAEGIVVGANSVVTHDLTEPWSIYVGSPCRKVRDRVRPSPEVTAKLMAAHNWNNHL